MGAYDIATAGTFFVSGHPKTNTIEGVQDFMRFIRETDDPIIKGLVSMMAEEIQHHRLDGNVYMGNSSINIRGCVADSEVLLARVLLDRSSDGTPPGYIKLQLNNIAWYISTRECGRDPFRNWLMAERRYVRLGLEYLAIRQKSKSDEKDKSA